jgi:hypothetical protein
MVLTPVYPQPEIVASKDRSAPGAGMVKLAGRPRHAKANQDRRDESPGPFGTIFMIPNGPWCHRPQPFARRISGSIIIGEVATAGQAFAGRTSGSRSG